MISFDSTDQEKHFNCCYCASECVHRLIKHKLFFDHNDVTNDDAALKMMMMMLAPIYIQIII